MSPLPPLDEDWRRALAVVAHPDDLEFGAAAAVARWTGQGRSVAYCLVTSGEAGIDGLEPAECRIVREDEERRSAAIVGVDEVEFLGFPDGVVEYGLELRRALAAAIRRHRPDIVLTVNFRDTWDGGRRLNQADHVATGRALVDAVADAGNRWVFRELLDAGSQPWAGVRQLWAAASPEPTHAVDVTGTFAVGVESLRAHEAYLAGLGSADFDPEAFLARNSTEAGRRQGCEHAVLVEVFPFHRW